MKWYHYLICGVLIVIGIFSSVNLIELFNVSSQEYGSVITIETQNNYNEVSKFDLGTFNLTPTTENNYSEVITLAPQSFDGAGKDYLILFNGKPANNIDSKSGQISGDVSMTFYDLDAATFTIGKENIIFHYNPGYLGCWADGERYIEIPIDTAKLFLSPNWKHLFQ
jgi:hypothetical protein